MQGDMDAGEGWGGTERWKGFFSCMALQCERHFGMSLISLCT